MVTEKIKGKWIQLDPAGGLTSTSNGLKVASSTGSFTTREVQKLTLSAGDITAGYKDLTNTIDSTTFTSTTLYFLTVGGQEYSVDYTIVRDPSGNYKRVYWRTDDPGGTRNTFSDPMPTVGMVGSVVATNKFILEYNVLSSGSAVVLTGDFSQYEMFMNGEVFG